MVPKKFLYPIQLGISMSDSVKSTDLGELLEAFEEYASSIEIESQGGLDSLLEDPYADLEPLKKLGVEALVIAVRQGAQLTIDPKMTDGCAKIAVSSDLMEKMINSGLYN